MSLEDKIRSDLADVKRNVVSIRTSLRDDPKTFLGNYAADCMALVATNNVINGLIETGAGFEDKEYLLARIGETASVMLLMGPYITATRNAMDVNRVEGKSRTGSYIALFGSIGFAGGLFYSGVEYVANAGFELSDVVFATLGTTVAGALLGPGKMCLMDTFRHYMGQEHNATKIPDFAEAVPFKRAMPYLATAASFAMAAAYALF